MIIKEHQAGNKRIAELLSDAVLMSDAQDSLELLANLGYQGFNDIIVYEKNIAPAFFDLKTRLAGDILQKFSNYRVKLAIVGSFETHTCKSIRDFIYESNQRGHICFAASVEEALGRLSGTKK